MTSAPQCLTVLAPILPGQEQRLRETLRAIGDDINGTRVAGERPSAHRVRSQPAHSLRAICDPEGSRSRRRSHAPSVCVDLRRQPRLAPGRARLDHVSTWTRSGERARATREYSEFPSFIRARIQEPAAYYIAFRDETVQSITGAIAARRRRQKLQDAGDLGAGDGADTSTGSRRASLLRWLTRAAPVVLDVLTAIARSGFGNVYHGTRQILGEPRSLPGIPAVQPDHRKPNPAAEVALQQHRARPVRSDCTARSGRRDSRRRRPPVNRRCGRTRSPRTS